MTIIDLRDSAPSVLDPAPAPTVLDAPPPVARLDAVPAARLKLASAIAIAAIAVLNLLDVVTTRAMLARGAIESNPLSKVLLPDGKVELIKAVVVGLLALRVLRRRPTIGMTAALWFGAGFYFLTVVSNLLILQRLG